MHTSTINDPFGSVLTCIYKTYKKEKIEDTKEVITSRKSRKDRQHNDQKIPEVITSRKSRKDRQHNDQRIPKR